MKNQRNEQYLKEFFSHFYEVCTSTDAFNYTIDELYDDFSPEMHDFLEKYAKIANER